MTLAELTAIVLGTGVIGGGNAEMRRAGAERIAAAVLAALPEPAPVVAPEAEAVTPATAPEAEAVSAQAEAASIPDAAPVVEAAPTEAAPEATAPAVLEDDAAPHE